MEVEFADTNLDRLETDPQFTAGFDAAIVKGFRKVVQAVRAAQDERDLYALRGLRFEKLKGKREHQRSLRINDQWRVILELKTVSGSQRARIIGIEDYH